MKKTIFLFFAITSLIACDKKDPISENIYLVGKSFYSIYKSSYSGSIYVSTIYFETENKLRYIQTREVINGEIVNMTNGTYTYNHPNIIAKIAFEEGEVEITGTFIDNKTAIVETDSYKDIYKLVE